MERAGADACVGPVLLSLVAFGWKPRALTPSSDLALLPRTIVEGVQRYRSIKEPVLLLVYDAVKLGIEKTQHVIVTSARCKT